MSIYKTHMEKTTVVYNNETTEIWIHVAPTDYVSNMIRWTKRFYENDLLAFIHLNFPPQKVIVDVGANIGNHSLFFAKYIGCQHLHAFEPVDVNARVFKENLAPYTSLCTLHEQALSDTVGQRTLYNCEKDNYGGFSLTAQQSSFTVQDMIPVATLDDFALKDVTLLKIDVENHENEVLRGAKTTIELNRPIIVLENSNYYFGKLFPDPNPHAPVLEALDYVRVLQNVCKSAMDVWMHKENAVSFSHG